MNSVEEVQALPTGLEGDALHPILGCRSIHCNVGRPRAVALVIALRQEYLQIVSQVHHTRTIIYVGVRHGINSACARRSTSLAVLESIQ